MHSIYDCSPIGCNRWRANRDDLKIILIGRLNERARIERRDFPDFRLRIIRNHRDGIACQIVSRKSFALLHAICASHATPSRQSGSMERFHFWFRYGAICIAVDRTWELTELLTSAFTWGAEREFVGEEF
jgi:hypothetical protein